MLDLRYPGNGPGASDGQELLRAVRGLSPGTMWRAYRPSARAAICADPDSPWRRLRDGCAGAGRPHAAGSRGRRVGCPLLWGRGPCRCWCFNRCARIGMGRANGLTWDKLGGVPWGCPRGWRANARVVLLAPVRPGRRSGASMVERQHASTDCRGSRSWAARAVRVRGVTETIYVKGTTATDEVGRLVGEGNVPGETVKPWTTLSVRWHGWGHRSRMSCEHGTCDGHRALGRDRTGSRRGLWARAAGGRRWWRSAAW